MKILKFEEINKNIATLNDAIEELNLKLQQEIWERKNPPLKYGIILNTNVKILDANVRVLNLYDRHTFFTPIVYRFEWEYTVDNGVGLAKIDDTQIRLLTFLK